MSDQLFDFQGVATGALALKTTAFFFLRHGRTGHNHRRIMQGHLDIPLDEVGRGQARQAADVLHASGAVGRIVASDLSRARETAEVVGARIGAAVDLDAGLRERSFGPLEDTAIVADIWSSPVEGVEPITDFADRVARSVAATVTSADTLVVAHGGVLRVLSHMLGATLPPNALSNAAPLRFSLTDPDAPSSGWLIEHLPGAGAVTDTYSVMGA